VLLEQRVAACDHEEVHVGVPSEVRQRAAMQEHIRGTWQLRKLKRT
jgi:hypothetical protein